jgi:ABC-type multidrug transport system permease subunit
MTLTGLGIALALIGLVLWLAAIAPGLGYALIIVGIIILIVSLFIGYRGRGL